MKKILALFLSTLLVMTTPVSAMSNSSDTNLDFLNNPYTITYADLENATGTMATPDDTTDKTYFGLYDSGEADHGMVYVIEATGWAATYGSKIGVTYTYDGKSQSLFNETLKSDSYYMFSYEYKNILTDKSAPSLGGYCYFAPQMDAYHSLNDNDSDEWIDVPPASVDTWSTRTGIFGTGSNTSFNVKINTAKTYTKTYIDNFSIIELAKIDLNSPNPIKLDTNGTGIIYDSGMDSYFAVKGVPATIKIAESSPYEAVAAAYHGEEELTAVGGAYPLDTITDNIKLDFAFSKEHFETSGVVPVEGNNIYVQMGKTLPQVMRQWNIALDTVNFKNPEGQAINSPVSPIIAGSSIALSYGGELKAEYVLKYLGDINDDSEVNVTDLLSLVDDILNDNYKRGADLNGSGTCTVSDIAALRRIVLDPPSIVQLPEKFRVLGIGNSFSIDGMEYLYDVAKAYGYKDEDIILGNLYIGGCTLETHWNKANTNAAAYTYSYYDIEKGAWKGIGSSTMLSGLVKEDWDYISFQQASKNSGQINTISPYLKNLIDYVKENKTNPDAKFMWHSTWAYAADYTSANFKYYNYDQSTMYNAIIGVGKHILTNYAENIQMMIPSGTAIQNMRTAVGDYLNRDGSHLNYNHGRLTASITWFKTITGANLEGIEKDGNLLAICEDGAEDLATKGVEVASEQLLEYCISSAEAAVESPYEITTIK